MIGSKQLAQYALLVVRQLEKLSPMERAEVLLIAGGLVQIDVNRSLRQPQPPPPVVDEWEAPHET